MINILNFFRPEIRFAQRSAGWSKIRTEHLKKNPSCAACGRTSKLEVHHKIPVHLRPDLELDLSNLITLCDSPCHFVFGHLYNYRSYNKFVEEDCAVYLNKVLNRP